MLYKKTNKIGLQTNLLVLLEMGIIFWKDLKKKLMSAYGSEKSIRYLKGNSKITHYEDKEQFLL